MFYIRFIIFCLTLALLQGCAVLGLLNSGTTHLKYTVSDTTFDGVHYKNAERFGDVSFSVRNIQHPYQYENWKFNVGLSPSIHYDKERYRPKETKSQLKLPDFDLLPEIQIRRLLGFANVKGSLHTPVGAFVLTAGLGLGLSERRDNQEYVHTTTKKISKIDLVWVGFISERFFIMAGPRYYNEDYEQLVFAFRLGYFWSNPDSG